MQIRPLHKLLCAAIGLGISLSASAADPLKVGFVYIGPIGDHGWTYQHEQARRQVQKDFGSSVQTTFVADVPEGHDAERVLRDLARQGNQIIFTTSFGYMEPAMRVAREFPAVKFEVLTGYKLAANVAIANARNLCRAALTELQENTTEEVESD